MSDLKQVAIDAINSLPDNVEWQDILEELYFRMKVAQGMKDADEGRVVPWEEVKAELGLL